MEFGVSKPNMNVGLGLSRSNVPSVEINFHPPKSEILKWGCQVHFLWRCQGGISPDFTFFRPSLFPLWCFISLSSMDPKGVSDVGG